MAHQTSRLLSLLRMRICWVSIRTYVRTFVLALGQGTIDRTFAFPKRKFRTRERSCQARWFEDYPFLHYDVARRRSLSPLLYSHNTISEGLNFKIFLGGHAPRPPYISAAEGGSPGYTLAHPIPKAVTRPGDSKL